MLEGLVNKDRKGIFWPTGDEDTEGQVPEAAKTKGPSSEAPETSESVAPEASVGAGSELAAEASADLTDRKAAPEAVQLPPPVEPKPQASEPIKVPELKALKPSSPKPELSEFVIGAPIEKVEEDLSVRGNRGGESTSRAFSQSPSPDPDEEDSSPRQETALDRIKANPVLLVPFAIAAICCIWLLSMVLGGGSSGEAGVQNVPLEVSGFPKIETPEIKDEQWSRDDIKRKLLEAEHTSKRQAAKQAAEAERAAPRNKDEELEALRAEVAELRTLLASRCQVADLGTKEAGKQETKLPRKVASYQVAAPPPAVVQESETNPEPEPEPEATGRRIPKSAAYYKAGGTIEVAEGKKEPAKEGGLPVGTTIRAELHVGVRTDSGETVLAKVKSAIKLDGKVLLPAGAILKGAARGGKADRLFVQFNVANIKGSPDVAIQGYAMQKGKQGIKARLVSGGGGDDPSKGGAVGRGAAKTAGSLISLIPGANVAGELARNVADEGIQDARSAGRSSESRERVLEAPAGTAFEVIITGG
jgi:hypothetical protein